VQYDKKSYNVQPYVKTDRLCITNASEQIKT